jgi:hypothetical protein
MRFSIRRSLVLACTAGLAATAMVSVAGAANAAVVAGGGRNADRTPVYVRDAEGIALQLCSDATMCEPADPAVGDIGSYFGAEASLGPMRAIWGIDAVFLENADGTIGDTAAVGNSALFRAEGLRPNRRYTIQGPWGTHRCFTNGEGALDNKNCLFEAGGEAGGQLRGGPVKSFLYSTRGPRGFIGGLEIPARVTGSPSGFNRVTLDGPGAHFATSLFSLSGQMADNTPMSQISKTALRMGNKQNTRPITRVLRYRNIGTAPARFRVSRGGENPVAFKVRENCAAVAPGRTCRIEVVYRPGAHDKSAVLTITDNTLAQPRRVTLRGVAPTR